MGSVWGEDVGVGSRAEASSSKPALTSLTLSAGTLTPAFSGTQEKYTVPDVPYGTRVLTITAVPESGAVVNFWHYPNGPIEELKDEDTETDGLQVSLAIGKKKVRVSVTKNSKYRDYDLEITRLKPVVSIRAVSEAPLYEGDTLKFEISRPAAVANFLAVRVLAEELEATTGTGHADLLPNDIDGKSPKEYIEAGDSTAIIEVETKGDKVWESHSKVRMTIVTRSDTLYTIDDSAGVATLVVQDDEFLASTGALTVSPNPVGEGAGRTTATVTVTTTGSKKPHGEASVTVETSDGTAEAGSDYTALDTSVKFVEADFSSVTVDGNTRYRATKTVDVAVTQDTVDEEGETFSVSASTDKGSPISIGSGDATVSVTITDDDEPAPTLTSMTVSAGTLTPAFSSGTLSYTVPDVGYGNNQLTITAGAESGATITFLDSSNNTLTDLDDNTAGHQVSIGIGVTAVKIRVTKGSASQDYSLSITRAKPTVSVRALTSSLATEGDKIKFEVARSASAGDTLAVKFTLDEIGTSTGLDPGDILPGSKEGTTQSVTIAAGKTTATVEVTTTSDSVWENHSKIELEIEDDDSYTVHATKDSASVLVRDDEFVASVAALSVAPNPVGEGAGKTVATVTVTTSGDKKPHGRVSIAVTTTEGTASAGSDFTALNASLSFSEGDFSGVEVGGNDRFRASKSVDVVILQDSLDDEDETFTVAMGTPSDTLVTLDTDSKSTSVTITDDESPMLTALSVSPGTLTPAFSSSGTSYTVPDVGYGSHRLTINATAESGATIAFLDSSNNTLTDLDDTATGHQVSLGIGDTTVKARVTEDGTSQDYTLVITRAKPTVSVRALTSSPATEGDKIKFEVARSASAGDTLAVKFSLDEVGASTGVDPGDILPNSKEGTSQSVTIAASKTTATIEVTTTSDSVWENHSKIEFEIEDDDSYTVHTTKDSASVLVRDDEFVASVAALSVSPNPVGEGAGKTVATVTVTTTGDKKPHGQVSVPVTTSAGTATAGSDFTDLDTSLTFAESDFSGVEVGGNDRFRASKSVDVVILQDSLDDEDETFSVGLGTPSDTLVTLDSDSKSTSVTITDDELPALTALSVSPGTLTPSFSSSTTSYTVPDVGYGTHRLTINATAESGASVSFVDSSGNTLTDLDGTSTGHQVSLGIGDTTVKARVTEDGASQDYTLVITRAKPTVSVRALTSNPATEGDKVKFEVARSASAGDTLAVKFTLDEVGASTGVEPGDILADSKEGTAQSVTIAASKTTATVEVTTTSDSTWENHSKIEMSIKDDDSYTVHTTKGTATILVRDDEFVASVAALSVSPNPVGEGAGKTVATVTVTTTGDKKPHGQVSVPVTTSEGTATAGSDFTALDTSLTFAEGDFSGVGGNSRFRASKSVDVVILQDTLDDEDETFTVALGTPSNTLVTLDSDSKSMSVTITDDELPMLTALSVSPGTLTPAFSSGTISYTVPEVGYGTHLATISATPESGAEVSFLDSSNNDYDDLDDTTEGHQVYMEIGSTTIKIRVEEEGAEQDYTLVFTRAKPVVSIRTVTNSPATEGDTLSFEVSRSVAAGDVLEVRVWMDEVDIVAGEGHGDILSDAIEDTAPWRTIKVDQSSLVFTVDTQADSAWEKHSKIEMTIKSEPEYDIHDNKGSATIVVRDDDFTDSVAALTISPNPVEETGKKAVATITVTTDDDKIPHGQVSIPIATSDSTATAGEDYTAVNSSLVFKEGDFGEIEEGGYTHYQASKSVEVPILDDNLDEDDETFNVALSAASQSVVDIDPARKSVSVTINDQNSKPVVTVSTTPSSPKVVGRGVITLDGTSSDSDNDTLTYAWTASPAGIGTFGNAAIEDTTWTAPAPLSTEQSVTLTLTVTDDGTPTGVTTADVAATVRANQAPSVEVTTKDGVVKGGGTVKLGATVSDAEAGEVGYQWLGGGSFGDESAKDTVWTAPAPVESAQTLTLTLTATDELGLTDSDSVEVTVPAANKKPTFPESEEGERGLDEGAGAGAEVGDPVAATDGDDDTLTYWLGGADAASFDIDGTGQITVAAGTTLDYEVKSEYSVEVSVSDGKNEAGDVDNTADATLDVTISVGDVEEAGVVVFSPEELKVGEEVRVSVQDPDNYGPSNTTGTVDHADVDSWLWLRSDNAGGPWTQISDATTAAYVPTVEDRDKYLRVTANYTDRRGPDKGAIGVWGPLRNRPPLVSVSPDMATINGCNAIMLNATTSDADGDVLSYSWTAYPNVGRFADESMEDTVWRAPDPTESEQTVVLTLTVSDGNGGTAAESVVVTVRGRPAGAGAGG